MEKHPVFDRDLLVDLDWDDTAETAYLCAKYKEQLDKEKQEYFSYLRYSE